MFHGFLHDDELASLYGDTDILVFPFFFGPTNLPPMEAAHYSIPHYEKSFLTFFGKQFLYFDPSDPSSLDRILKKAILNTEKIDYTEFFKRTDKTRKIGIKRLNKAIATFEVKVGLWNFDLD